MTTDVESSGYDVALWGGSGLSVRSNNPTVVANPVPERSSGEPAGADTGRDDAGGGPRWQRTLGIAAGARGSEARRGLERRLADSR